MKGMRAITRRRMYSSPSPGDSPVEEEVEKAEESEGDEGHHQEVSEEDVVPHVLRVLSQFCGTQLDAQAGNF